MGPPLAAVPAPVCACVWGKCRCSTHCGLPVELQWVACSALRPALTQHPFSGEGGDGGRGDAVLCKA